MIRTLSIRGIPGMVEMPFSMPMEHGGSEIGLGQICCFYH